MNGISRPKAADHRSAEACERVREKDSTCMVKGIGIQAVRQHNILKTIEAAAEDSINSGCVGFQRSSRPKSNQDSLQNMLNKNLGIRNFQTNSLQMGKRHKLLIFSEIGQEERGSAWGRFAVLGRADHELRLAERQSTIIWETTQLLPLCCRFWELDMFADIPAGECGRYKLDFGAKQLNLFISVQDSSLRPSFRALCGVFVATATSGRGSGLAKQVPLLVLLHGSSRFSLEPLLRWRMILWRASKDQILK